MDILGHILVKFLLRIEEERCLVKQMSRMKQLTSRHWRLVSDQTQ